MILANNHPNPVFQTDAKSSSCSCEKERTVISFW